MTLAELRADVVGSLLRPRELHDAVHWHGQGVASDEELSRAQDEAVRLAVLKQETIGLPVVTDGEFRRVNFMDSFAASVSGVEPWRRRLRSQVGPSSESEADTPGLLRNPLVPQPVTRRLRLARNLPLEEYRYAQGLTQRPVKVSLINSDRILERTDIEASRPIYSGSEDFLADVIAIQREMLAELAEAGCRYVQIDAPGYTRFVDEHSVQQMRTAGQDPDLLLERSIEADNQVIASLDRITFGLHVCRGNERSHWHREGPYDAIAERLLCGLQHQRFLLEYDTERAGGFEPLRFLPRGRLAVLGLISTKANRVETVDELQRRIEEASRHMPVEQLAISPQCGFASVMAGNQLTEDEQWRKLEVMLDVARRVWG